MIYLGVYIMDPLSAAILLAIAAVGALIIVRVAKIAIPQVTGWFRERFRRRKIDVRKVGTVIDEAIKTGNVGHISGVLLPFTIMDDVAENKEYDITAGLYDPVTGEVVEAEMMRSKAIDAQIKEQHREKKVIVWS